MAMPAFSFCSLFLAPKNTRSILKHNLFLIIEAWCIAENVFCTRRKNHYDVSINRDWLNAVTKEYHEFLYYNKLYGWKSSATCN